MIAGRLYWRRRTMTDYGSGYISGGPETVPASGVLHGTLALARKVTLHHQRSMRIVDMQWSASDGSFLFEDLAPEHYVAISWDYVENSTRLRAGIQDFIWPQFD